LNRSGSNAGKAGADVVTLGEEGRRRDRERAQAAEQQAKSAAEAAERERQLKIKATNDQIALLTAVLASTDANCELADNVEI